MNHIDRMLDERSELVIKQANLRSFMKGDIFKTLAELDQQLMRQQEYVMTLYISILTQRIDRATTRPE